MPDKWVTFAEAAAAMKVHPRTVERQIKSGKLQSRRTPAGQLEILIDIPESAAVGADALSVVAGQAENQVQFALGATSAIVKTAQEDARLARLDSDRLECGRGDGSWLVDCSQLDRLRDDTVAGRVATCRRSGEISVRRCRTTHDRA
jgi:hypothetical protein